MNSKLRRQNLLNELKNSKTVNILELAEKFDVSSMTIRRDLQKFAEDEIVTLVHGGAVFNEGVIASPSASAREKKMLREKSLIAKICANLINEGNAIFLDSGSTALSIASTLIDRKNIAVITNSLPVLNILAGSKDLQLIAVAGIYKPTLRGFFGDMALRHVRNFRLDIAFLGVNAVSVEFGLMSNDLFDCNLKRAVIECSRKKILVTDHTKIGKETFLRICDLSAMNQIVMDQAPDENFLQRAEKLGIEILHP